MTLLSGKKVQEIVLYLHVAIALYGLIKSTTQFYKKLVKYLQHHSFELNPYEPGIANKTLEGKQMTVSWHVNDLKVSHVNPKEIYHFLKRVQETYKSFAEQIY